MEESEEEEVDEEEEIVEEGDKVENDEESSPKRKRGVVYLSRVPPFMKPVKVKHLLSAHGKITNIYLQPEDESVRRARIKRGGTHKIRFLEGWIEFEKKSKAKMAAILLNGQKVGGKKSNFWAEDLWNLKYLRGFKWTHLSEKQAYERRIQSQKLRTEMLVAKKENEYFLEKVKQSNQIKKIAEKKQSAVLASSANGKKRKYTEVSASEEVEQKPLRQFKQRKPMSS
jgi:ESF2/ABP1 family protein